MSRRVAVALVVALGVCAVSGAALADYQKLAADGTLHSVSVQTWSAAGSTQTGGTAIEYTRQLPNGDQLVTWIPGTDEPGIDREPAIDLDPASDEPFVVWSRNEGNGFDLFVSKRVAGSWTPPQRVFSTAATDRAPEIRVTDNWVHLIWRDEWSIDVSFSRATLDPDTLAPVHGPEVLPTSAEGDLVPPEGESAPGKTPEPSTDRFYSSGAFLAPLPGHPGQLQLWGVRDEPIPIDFLTGFRLPADVRSVNDLEVRWLAGRFTVSFRDGDAFYYTMRKDGRWTDLRTIVLDELTNAYSAVLRIEEMIKRDQGE